MLLFLISDYFSTNNKPYIIRKRTETKRKSGRRKKKNFKKIGDRRGMSVLESAPVTPRTSSHGYLGSLHQILSGGSASQTIQIF